VAGAAMSLNEMMLTAGAGAAGGKLAQLAANVGVKRFANAAAAGSKYAQRALKFAKYAPAAGGMLGGGISEGTLAAGASGVAVEEQILALDHDELIEGSPRYFEVYAAAEGMSEEQRREYARATVAEEAGKETAVM